MSDETPTTEPGTGTTEQPTAPTFAEIFLPHGQEARTVGLTALALVVYPWLFTESPVLSGLLQGYHPLASLILVWGIFALGFNILLGYTGLLSFGHAAFWGGSAYAAGIFSERFMADPLAILVVAIVFAVLLSWVIGFISLRRGGIYFAILTLAFGQMLFYLSASPLGWLTGGENGFTGVVVEPVLGMFDLGTDLPLLAVPGLGTGLDLALIMGTWLYLFIAIFTLLAVALGYRILKSPYGMVFKAIRENEQRAEFVGLNVWRYKLMAFIISGGFAGLAGGLYVIHQQYVPLSSLNWAISGEVVVMAVLGGTGSLIGPMFGAGLYKYIQNVISGMDQLTVPLTDVVLITDFGTYWHLLLGLVFVLIVWLAPRGLWGAFEDGRDLVGRVVDRLRGGEN
ncbi:branched-chain amino acid ABC transporter permease [Halobacteriales archaeon Cl-PHB]